MIKVINMQSSDLNPEQEEISLSVHFTKIEAVKQSDSQYGEVEYPIDLNMGEATTRLDGTALVTFKLKVGTKPNIANFELTGEATIKGPTELVHRLTIPEGGSPPPIWRQIYQEAISTVSLLARFVNVPPPPAVS